MDGGRADDRRVGDIEVSGMKDERPRLLARRSRRGMRLPLDHYRERLTARASRVRAMEEAKGSRRAYP